MSAERRNKVFKARIMGEKVNMTGKDNTEKVPCKDVVHTFKLPTTNRHMVISDLSDMDTKTEGEFTKVTTKRKRRRTTNTLDAASTDSASTQRASEIPHKIIEKKGQIITIVVRGKIELKQLIYMKESRNLTFTVQYARMDLHKIYIENVEELEQVQSILRKLN